MTKEQIKEIIEMCELETLEKMKKDGYSQETRAYIEFWAYKTILWLFEDEEYAEKMYGILLERRRAEKELEELKRSWNDLKK